ncbi:hypothetical protein [Athalassotoga saccharophila]|uniref:hypothetical protein n=1 Tax=Athalassotoga saccharophila TaxID=1441386 RepID=UPI00137B2CEA|nr:hypothetical protein [Athalassotoga saccharophila]BBJ28411.1 hypothetical protein ATHSA_1324 [Athalassotoga saccharophila]
MIRKITILGFVILIASSVFAGVLNYVPQNANLVILFQNNGQNYDSLKNNVPIFSFLLNDLGLESLVQSSVSNTANSLNFKSSQIWSFTLNDFVIFANESQKDLAIVAKGDSTVLVKFIQSLIGGQIGSTTLNGKKIQSVTINGITVYFYSDSGYTIISNSTSMINDAINANASNKSFAFNVSYPKNAWFVSAFNGSLLTNASTNLVNQNGGYAYGVVSNGQLYVYGKDNLVYKDQSLKKAILSSKVNSLSLATNSATGEMWISADIPNPSDFYNILKPYISKNDASDISNVIGYLNGKVFAQANLISSQDYVITMYLSKDISSLSSLSKDANGQFTWQGHTVLRYDTTEGTKTVHDYTIIYPDRIVSSNMQPDNLVKYLSGAKPAQSMGIFPSLSSQLWQNSFLTVYVNSSGAIENMLQYSVNSGVVIQARNDSDGNIEFQMIVK